MSVRSFLPLVPDALIAEGVGDMIFAIQNGIFSWQGYPTHKMWSVALTVATADVGWHLSRDAISGRAA